MNNKIIISSLIIIIVGAFGYFVLNFKSKPFAIEQEATKNPAGVEKTDTDISTADTNEWKTYVDSEFGFEFKYPPTFLMEMSSSPENSDKYIVFTDSNLQEGYTEKASFSLILDYSSKININFADNYHEVKYDPEKRKCLQSGNFEHSFYQEEKINDYHICIFGEGDAGWGSETYYFIHPTKEITVGFTESYSPNEREDYSTAPSYLNDIIHTFKFTSPSEKIISMLNSDWKTYINQEYGFEFKYPSYFSVEDLSKEHEQPIYIKFTNRFIPPGYTDEGSFDLTLNNSSKIDINISSGYHTIYYDSEKRKCREYPGNQLEYHFQENKINGYNVCVYEHQWGGGTKTYYFIHPTKEIAIGFTIYKEKDLLTPIPIDYILSTFKFTN